MADIPMMLEVANRIQESRDVISLHLKVVGGTFQHFVAGQHLPLRLDLPERKVATYTISSDPADHSGYRISVKLEVDGKGGSRFLHEQAQIGTRLAAEAPRGGFVLVDDARPVLLLTGGIGITPALAMLTVLVRQPERPVYFVHACMNAAQHSFAEELAETVAGTAHIRNYTVFAEGGDNDLASGRCQEIGLLGRDSLRNLLPLDAYHVYLCGPVGFMVEMRGLLCDLGVPDGDIRQEIFGASSVGAIKKITPVCMPQSLDLGAEKAEVRPLVRFVRSGIEVVWDGTSKNLLELAETQGLTPEFECRSGICGTCACRKVSGNVTYTEDLIDSPQAGEVFICCSVPEGTVEIDL